MRIVLLILGIISFNLSYAKEKASSCDSLSVTITVNDSVEYGSYNIRFNADVKGEGNKVIRYTWNYGDSKSETTFKSYSSHIFTTAGTYNISLAILDTNQKCTASASTSVTIENTLHTPNVFTPNSDGINDLFIIEGNGTDVLEFHLYNPYGNLVFQRSATNIIWDGKNLYGHEVPNGTYYYTLSGKNGKKNGTIHLFR